MKTAVLGAGPGGLAIAADVAGAGGRVVVSDMPKYSINLEAVRRRGGIRIVSGWRDAEIVEVEVEESIPAAVSGAELVIVSVAAVAHQAFVEQLLPALRTGAPVLFMGEGGGALIAYLGLQERFGSEVLIGETNCLPYIAKLAGPGAVAAERKTGGVLLAGMPATTTHVLLEIVRGIWGFIEPTESVWETVLINYDAIDIVPVAICNAGTIEGRSGGMLLWGEGATRSVVRVIEAVDSELLALRKALGHRDQRRYSDFLVAQGLAARADDLHEMIRRAGLVRSVRPSGSPEHLRDRLELEVEYSLVLAASIGRAVRCPTPVIDGVVALSGAMLGHDPWVRGRTLTTLGLANLTAVELRQLALTGALVPSSNAAS